MDVDDGTKNHRQSFFSWVPTSDASLQAAESRMLEGVKSTLRRLFVKLSSGNLIRTIHTEKAENDKRLPIVLVHGFAAGLGFWTSNIDPLSEKQNVYAIDLLGFGRSSRPDFPSDAEEIEKLYVESIEEWRQKIGLTKFVLCGHSFGGYLACAYALKHPEGISHLVLADPWGFPEAPPPGEEVIKISKFRRAIYSVLGSFNPFAVLRLAGPYGPSLVARTRPDIQEKFEGLFGEGDTRVMDYIYHCNAKKPSGETAFKSMSINMVYSKYPMISRLKNIDSTIPITVIYGGNSWMMKLFDFSRVKHERSESYVDVKTIKESGHHIYLDQKDEFNDLMEEICTVTESLTDPSELKKSISTDAIDAENPFLIFSP